MIVPTLRVEMPPGTLRVHRCDAERRRTRYHAERGNDQSLICRTGFSRESVRWRAAKLWVNARASSRLKPVPLKSTACIQCGDLQRRQSMLHVQLRLSIRALT